MSGWIMDPQETSVVRRRKVEMSNIVFGVDFIEVVMDCLEKPVTVACQESFLQELILTVCFSDTLQ